MGHQIEQVKYMPILAQANMNIHFLQSHLLKFQDCKTNRTVVILRQFYLRDCHSNAVGFSGEELDNKENDIETVIGVVIDIVNTYLNKQQT
ncbi:unnamed protein product [Paramecium octaurelia]|uniref:Uncharacterized protein n=1 Tax=Paramecium octaurelia TaxID=43137 RepID=A0A8S1Y5L7_PAROT|nr:unnamed protein product [Paramecium octaurelia]